jgi:hypothetical protein
MCFQFRIKDSISQDLKEIVVAVLVNEQCSADGKIVVSINLDRRVPNLDDTM